MKKILLAVLLVFSSIYTVLSYADDTNLESSLVHWISKDGNDTVSIQNGSGLTLTINIHVNSGGAGINIVNCGSTFHVNAGSTVLCSSNDPSSTVSFTSDASDVPATGTYLIKQQ